MNVKMIGIDHTRAGVEVRQCFAFTKKAMAAVMEKLKQNHNIHGCVILSTCNRMELWVSLKAGESLRLPELLWELKGQDCQEYWSYFQEREGEAAVYHLFSLSAGMESQIMGEDQILSQVREAAAFAREQGCMDSVLEVLFRMAVTAGKQVKTKVPMDHANFSAAHQALKFLKEQGMNLRGKNCLVIGNGEMGKVTALALMEEGANVTVTVRQYRSGMVNIPKGAKRIDYGNRYKYIPDCDLVFSATASPNLTITKEGAAQCKREKKQIYIDLAVPRDIQQSLGELENVVLYDIDSFHINIQSEQMKEQQNKAEVIIREHLFEFYQWQQGLDLVPGIIKIGSAAAKEFCWRMEKTVRELKLEEIEKEELKQQMEQKSQKVVEKLLFSLRNQLDQETLSQCLEILEQVYTE